MIAAASSGADVTMSLVNRTWSTATSWGATSRSASDSFLLHWSCVERRRHCRLTNPHPVPLPGRGRRAASPDASCTTTHASVAGFNTRPASATGGSKAPAAAAARIGRESWLSEQPSRPIIALRPADSNRRAFDVAHPPRSLCTGVRGTSLGVRCRTRSTRPSSRATSSCSPSSSPARSSTCSGSAWRRSSRRSWPRPRRPSPPAPSPTTSTPPPSSCSWRPRWSSSRPATS